jgi:glycosyltransferase involved in cell wall biosynthesis
MRISVIVATYGDESWSKLADERALPSAEAQDADAVIFLHEEEGTRASSLNQGARGFPPCDWLIFLDADDELAPGYVGAMRRAAEQHDAGDMVLFTPAVQHIRKGRPSTPAFMDRGISLRDDNWMVIGTMIHRDLFNQVGGFDDHPHGFEDWALWSKCYRLGAEIIKVPDAVYRYWHNPQSAHKRGWRDRKTQVATHIRIKAELDAWEAAR